MQLSQEQREGFTMELLNQMYEEAMSWQPPMMGMGVPVPPPVSENNPIAELLENAKGNK